MDRETRVLQQSKQKSTETKAYRHIGLNDLTEGVNKIVYIKGGGIYDVIKYNNKIYYSLRYTTTKDELISSLGGTGEGIDTSAIHDDTPGEIAALVEKTDLADGDMILIEDSEDSNNKKKVSISNMTGKLNYKFIKATSQSEGDLHLSDGTNWNVDKAHISKIKVVTSSTDWDLYLLQNDNGYATDDANIPMTQLMGNGNGNLEITVNEDYEDEDATGEVHLYYLDNSGSNTADIYIEGYELK